MTSLQLLKELLGEQSGSPRLSSFLKQTTSAANITLPEAEIKAYSNSVYFNYRAIGLSLMFIPAPGGHNPKLKTEDYREFILDSIDIYNPLPPSKASEEIADTATVTETETETERREKEFAPFPLLPIDIVVGNGGIAQLKTKCTGQDIVRMLGEPERKGGGSGPSSGSISIWCEWTKKGVMVEFDGDKARGPQAWEHGKSATWAVFTVFPSQVGA